MPKNAYTHEENRFKVCYMCFKKQKEMFKITNPIKIHIISLTGEFIEKDSIPAALCSSCRRNLFRDVANKKKVNSPDFSSFPPLKKHTRSNLNENCDCRLCEIARSIPVNLTNKFSNNELPGEQILKIEKS